MYPFVVVFVSFAHMYADRHSGGEVFPERPGHQGSGAPEDALVQDHRHGVLRGLRTAAGEGGAHGACGCNYRGLHIPGDV